MKPSIFSVIYKTTHMRCNKLLQKSDYRIKTIEDIKKIQKESKPFRLYCSNCLEETEPTLVDVYISEGLSVKLIIENLPIARFNETKLDLAESV